MAPLDRIWPRHQVVNGHGKPPGPILVIDRRGSIDAIAPTEEILDWKNDEIGIGVGHHREQGVPERVGIAIVRVQIQGSKGGQVEQEPALVVIRAVPPFGHGFGIVRTGRRDADPWIAARIAKPMRSFGPLALPARLDPNLLDP